ncbi:MAG: precorrin-4 C(11)-methyltransferase [Firmicutes bacterium]|nr:precorrin-4 C(11)-methyltransferase [Bacillota bacterium]
MIYFVGAGSGAPDLITVRGRTLLHTADVIIYAGSLVNPELLKGIREDAEVHNSAYLDLDQVMEIMYRSQEEGKMLVRLHTGDPSIYGAVREQMDRLEERKIPFEVCPGVSSFSGAAASLKAEYTLPGVSQTLILTRMEGRTPVPPREKIRELARHGASMAVFLSAGMTERLQAELLASGGYSPETPCAVVYKATWPEEKIVRTELQNLAEETVRAGIRKTALILVGGFLGNDYELSKLYDKHFATEFRPAAPAQTAAAVSGTAPEPVAAENPDTQPEPAGKKPLDVALAPDPVAAGSPETAPEPVEDAPDPYMGRRVLRKTALCFADRGEALGRKLDGVRVLRHGRDFTKTGELTAKLFETEDAILFISAAGIAVRSIANEIRSGSKQTDPAVLVLDEGGQFVIPILSGHLGGANALAQALAERLGSRAVITTATDSRGIESIDLLAQRCGYHINDMAAAKAVTAAMLRGQPAEIRRVPDPAGADGEEPDALEVCVHPEEARAGELNRQEPNQEPDTLEIHANPPAVTLTLTPKRYVLGIGCRRDTPPERLLAFVREELRRLAISEEQIYAVCSIEDKAGELAIHQAARHFHSPFLVFTAEQLEKMPGEFTGSEFVRQTVGTDNVCERSAMAGCGGRFDGFVLRKTAGSGVTLAAARRKPDPAEVENAAYTRLKSGQEKAD